MSRWITIANRLPFQIDPDSDDIRAASGGLVSALKSVKRSGGENIWIGTSPEGLTPENWSKFEAKLRAADESDWSYKPIFIDPVLYEAYYNGFCNDVLWPLLHYQNELATFDARAWQAYQDVNERFAQAVIAIADNQDLIWIHDFHLFLLPRLIKKSRPNLRVGFFLHVPFPSSELFRELPYRTEILESLLSSDLVGFHDYSYLQHFTSSVRRLMGYESDFLGIRRDTHLCRLGVFPVSIDTERFMKRSREPEIRSLCEQVSHRRFTFLGVDRLDYMKGLDLKFRAYQTFLRRFPQARERVVMIQVAVPTRQRVPAYTKLASDINGMIGEINGEFATPKWSPIHYIHASVDFDRLLALYRSADALLVSSKRDGMNLVALEFVAAQDRERPGVVLLSEFAGASSTLSHAIVTNPWDLEDTALKMQIAMEMPKQEKRWRAEQMQAFLKRYTSSDWAQSFIRELNHESLANNGARLTMDPEEARPDAVARRLLEFNPEQILLLLDYDGTLVPIAESPDQAVLPARVRDQLARLTRYEWLRICVISGRERRFLAKQFAGLELILAAEHGAKVFDPLAQKWRRRVHTLRRSWYPSALKIMQDYALRVPGSHVEKKQFCLSWHYRKSPAEYGEMQARKLAQELESGLANLPVSIIRGKKIIEARTIEANKGALARAMIEGFNRNVVGLAMGDDRTDEEMFSALKGSGVSVRVGAGETVADLRLPSQADVLVFLSRLVEMLERRLSRSHSRLSESSPAVLAVPNLV